MKLLIDIPGIPDDLDTGLMSARCIEVHDIKGTPTHALCLKVLIGHRIPDAPFVGGEVPGCTVHVAEGI